MTRIAYLLIFLFPALIYAESSPKEVSIIQLISNPSKFNGKRVLVSGFLHVKFEDSVLYLTKEHADHLMGKEGLWVNYAKRITFVPNNITKLASLDGKPVTLEATFEFSDEFGHGHMGLNSGELSDVDRIISLTKYYNGSEKIER